MRSLKRILENRGYFPEKLITETGIIVDGFELIYYKVHGSKALNFRGIVKDYTSYYPLILSEPFNEWFPEEFQYEMKPKRVIKKALKINPAKFLKKRLMEIYENYKEMPNEIPRGKWDENTGRRYWLSAEYINPYDKKPKHKEQMDVILIPKIEPWQVFAYIPFGGWNDCPLDYEHASVWKMWGEKYHTFPCAFQKSSIIEGYCGDAYNISKGEIINIAIQHFMYCEDIVYQGTRTIDRLASEVHKSELWWFWWD